jgi:hypothetical protein
MVIPVFRVPKRTVTFFQSEQAWLSAFQEKVEQGTARTEFGLKIYLAK